MHAHCNRLGSFLALAFLFAGCSGMNIIQPSGMQDTPERATPSGQPGLDTGSTPGYRYTATTDASLRPPTLAPAIDKDSGTAFARARVPIGTTPFEASGGFFVLGFTGQLKAQLLGPAATRARKGDFSLALLGQLQASSETKSGDHNGEFGPGGFHWKGKISSHQLAGEAIAGYRVIDDLLVYGGLYTSTATIRTSIDHQEDGGLPAASYSLREKVSRSGPVFGAEVRLGQHFAVLGELMSLRTTTSSVKAPDAMTTASVSIRFTFGGADDESESPSGDAGIKPREASSEPDLPADGESRRT